MKIVVISDTHGLHEDLDLPEGDVIIHGGDITDSGNKDEVIKFLGWYSNLSYSHKIFIGGNHDIYLDEQPVDLLELLPKNVRYLNNQSYDLEGIKIWGSPNTPDLEGWAFGKKRSDMEEHWKYLPEKIDILITHTPPFGILDKSSNHRSLGCEYLLEKVNEIQPQYHIFGHIHASYGEKQIESTRFINGSNLDSYKGLINPPIIVNYEQ